MPRAAVLVLLALPSIALAQRVHHLEYFDTQALRYSKQGEVTACGVRFMGVAGSFTEVVDASVNVRKSAQGYFGVVKFISSDLSMKDGVPKLNPARLRSAWIRAREGSPVRLSNEPMRGDDGASILYSLPPDAAAALLLAVVKRESFYIAVMRESASGESVFSGPVKLTQRDADELALCLDEIKR